MHRSNLRLLEKSHSAKVTLFFSLQMHCSKFRRLHFYQIKSFGQCLTLFVPCFLKLSLFLDLNFKILFILCRCCCLMLVISFPERLEMKAFSKKFLIAGQRNSNLNHLPSCNDCIINFGNSNLFKRCIFSTFTSNFT